MSDLRCRRSLAIAVSVVLGGLSAACSDTVEWREEVRLMDGRVVEVHQKKRCDPVGETTDSRMSCVVREAWMTMHLPEISDAPIEWHENLNPLVVNVYDGKLYVIGFPPTAREFRAYGAKNPPYIGYLWQGGRWQSIEFTEIPKALYRTNMLIEGVPGKKVSLLSLAQKEGPEENGAMTKPAYFRQIDPGLKGIE